MVDIVYNRTNLTPVFKTQYQCKNCKKYFGHSIKKMEQHYRFTGHIKYKRGLQSFSIKGVRNELNFLDSHPDSYSEYYKCPKCEKRCGYLVNDLCFTCYTLTEVEKNV